MKIIDEYSLKKNVNSHKSNIRKCANDNNISIEMIENKDYGLSLSIYIFLTYLYELEDVNRINDLDIFYNRYIWFLRFSKQKEKIDNYDPGINQQILRLFEEIDYRILNVDWNIIQKISEDLEKE